MVGSAWKLAPLQLKKIKLAAANSNVFFWQNKKFVVDSRRNPNQCKLLRITRMYTLFSSQSCTAYYSANLKQYFAWYPLPGQGEIFESKCFSYFQPLDLIDLKD